MIQTRPAEAPAVPAKTTCDVLLHAALLIEERGHTKNVWEHQGALCAIGAINLVTTGDPENDDGDLNFQAWKALAHYTEDTYGEDSMEWNDAPGRTAAEVIAALRAAADSA